MRCLILALSALTLIAGTIASPALAESDDEAALWRALRDGEAFAMIRHALAPGTGDPANFAVEDCATQRNLNDVGREQARQIGARFRANGIESAEVYSSQWCRCLETAELMDLGPVTELPALNSFFGQRDRGPAQTEALKDWLVARDSDRPLALSTHQVNITAMTGRGVASGEIYVLRLEPDRSVTVLGSIETPTY